MPAPTYNPEGKYAQELQRWEQPNYVHQEYPLMMFRAARQPQGGVVVSVDPQDGTHLHGSCVCVVNDEEDRDRHRADGWRGSAKEALEHFEGLERDVAEAAAHREYVDRNMSPAAKQEVRAAEVAADGAHVPEVPRSPIQNRVDAAIEDAKAQRAAAGDAPVTPNPRKKVARKKARRKGA